jgi:hypothetical protein
MAMQTEEEENIDIFWLHWNLQNLASSKTPKGAKKPQTWRKFQHI